MAIMSDYEPDPATAKLFARYKQAAEIIKNDKKRVLEAAEAAIRDHRATSPELAKLTGMSGQTFRTMAEKLGVDIRVKPPTTGPKAEARRVIAARPAPEPSERPSPAAAPTEQPWQPSADLGLELRIRELALAQARRMVAEAETKDFTWVRRFRNRQPDMDPRNLAYVIANAAWLAGKAQLPAD